VAGRSGRRGVFVAPAVAMRLHSARGFTLIEVIVALGVVLALASASAQLVSMTVRANAVAQTLTAAVILAQQKMEELLSEAGLGLNPSPAGALAQDRAGCFDVVNWRGHTLRRRWSIEPLAGGAGGTLTLQVLVTDLRDGAHVRLVAAKAQAGF
jgi:prepilin-type N-terminal cleavage/methylation domain-containing protein